MDAFTICFLVFGGIFCLIWMIGGMQDAANGVDRRSPEQKLMDTHIGDRVTTLGAALDAVNAEARGRRPKSSF